MKSPKHDLQKRITHLANFLIIPPKKEREKNLLSRGTKAQIIKIDENELAFPTALPSIHPLGISPVAKTGSFFGAL